MDTSERVADLPDAHRAAPRVVGPDDPISDAIRALLAEPRGRNVYVVDPQRRLLGVLSFRDLLRVSNARYGADTGGWLRQLRGLMPERAGDVMRQVTPVREETPLRQALGIMERGKLNDLPIVDTEGRLVGELNALMVMELALRVFERTEADLAKARMSEGAHRA